MRRIKSQYKTVRGVEYKTCPGCTASEGKPVWLPLADFGERQVALGEFIPQSYCSPCRHTYKRGGAA